MNSKKIQFLFNKFAKDYEKHVIETNHVNVQNQIIDNFLEQINGNVLDITTGTGTIARYIRNNTNCDVYGIDFSQEMIQEARKLSNGINFKVGDIHNLPYQNNSFEVVTCSYGFYWVEDIEKAIAEIKRVLKPKGLFILLEEEFRNGNEPKPRFLEKGSYLEELANLENYVGVDYLKCKLKDANFKSYSRKKTSCRRYS